MLKKFHNFKVFMLKSFKTLFRSPYHLKLWSFMRDTFDEEFVVIVDEIIEELQ